MWLLLGPAMLVFGFVAGLYALFTIDYAPVEWLSSLCSILAMPFLACGAVVSLVDLGLWLGHPHVLHF